MRDGALTRIAAAEPEREQALEDKRTAERMARDADRAADLTGRFRFTRRRARRCLPRFHCRRVHRWLLWPCGPAPRCHER